MDKRVKWSSLTAVIMVFVLIFGIMPENIRGDIQYGYIRQEEEINGIPRDLEGSEEEKEETQEEKQEEKQEEEAGLEGTAEEEEASVEGFEERAEEETGEEKEEGEPGAEEDVFQEGILFSGVPFLADTLGINSREMIQEAIDNAEGYREIALEGSIDIDTAIRITNGKNIYIKSVSGQAVLDSDVNTVFNVEEGGTLTIENIVLDGGGVSVKGTFTMKKGAKIENCIKEGYGGVMLTDGGSFYMDGGEISGNVSTGYGGGVRVHGDSYFEMNGGLISGNQTTRSTGGGGGVFIMESIFVMNGGTISGNFADPGSPNGDGGGIRITGGSEVYLKGGEISDNYCNNTGGGVYSENSHVTVDGCTIKNNTAKSGGGGIFFVSYKADSARRYQGILTVKSGEVSGNKSETNSGGGIYMYGHSKNFEGFKMEGGTISENRANNTGGGIFIYYAAGCITGGAIEKNMVLGMGGGGIHVYPAYTKLTIEKASVAENSAPNGDGGGIYVNTDYSSLVTYEQVIFDRNWARAAAVPPENADIDYEFIKYGTVSIMEHPLNNFDINWAGTAAELHTILYKPNGGRGDDFADYQGKGYDYTVRSNELTGFTRNGYVFKGWNTQPDGGGTFYEPGDIISVIEDNYIFYAIWEKGAEPVKPPEEGGNTEKPEPKPEPRPHESKEDRDSDYETPKINTREVQENLSEETPVKTESHYGYLVGYEDGAARPEGYISRAETATVFFRLLDGGYREQVLTKENNYEDVYREDWFNTAVSTVTAAGIFTGYSDGSFKPHQPVTRGEFAAAASMFSGYEYQGADLFTDTRGHWAASYINLACTLGWVSGYGNSTFRPDNYITRGEAASLINRVFERLPESKGDLLAEMIVFWDNTDEEAWYYLDIQEAANSHNYERKADGIHEYWTEIIQGPDWIEIEKP